jgi:hypothetical protein
MMVGGMAINMEINMVNKHVFHVKNVCVLKKFNKTLCFRKHKHV